jgi:hypothetical protein
MVIVYWKRVILRGTNCLCVCVLCRLLLALQSPTCHRGGMLSIPGKSVYDMRWTEGSGTCFPPVIVIPPVPHIYLHLNTALIEQPAGKPGKHKTKQHSFVCRWAFRLRSTNIVCWFFSGVKQVSVDYQGEFVWKMLEHCFESLLSSNCRNYCWYAYFMEQSPSWEAYRIHKYPPPVDILC